MRAPDTFKFLSIVLLTLCTTKHPASANANVATAELKRPVARALLQRQVCGPSNCAPRPLPSVSRSGSS